MGFIRKAQKHETSSAATEASCICDLPSAEALAAQGLGEGTIWECPECGRRYVYLVSGYNSLVWVAEKLAPRKYRRKYLGLDEAQDLNKVFFSKE